MGITIHFQGKLKNTQLIYSLKDELIDISETMEWKWQLLDEDWSRPTTAKLSVSENGSEIVGHLPLKGIQIDLHPDSEPLSLYFDSEGNLMTPISMILINEGKIKPVNSYSTVKTQFAPFDIHITIIKLLKYLKKQYVPDLKVTDEGEYWESGDREKLIEKMAFLQDKIDLVRGIVASLDSESVCQYSSEQLAKILEEKLRRNV